MRPRSDQDQMFMFRLRPSIHRLVTDMQVNVYWKYVVESELSKLTYVED